MWEQERPTAHACNMMFVVRGLQLERPRETRTERFVDDTARTQCDTTARSRAIPCARALALHMRPRTMLCVLSSRGPQRLSGLGTVFQYYGQKRR